MLRKNFTLRAPVDKSVVQLEQLLTTWAGSAAQIFVGEYMGSGTTKTILTHFTPAILIIAPKVNLAKWTGTVNRDWVFTMFNNKGASYIPNVGIVNDAVTDITPTNFVIGANAAVNTANQTYMYFMLG